MTGSSTCNSIIAETLRSAGIRYVFGHPGGEVVDLIEALAQYDMEFVLTGHESTAAFMAGVVGRMTGLPGVCLATLGPGACNLVLGVGCAYLDRDPLIAFSARTATDRYHISNKQNLRLNDIFEPITKWSIALEGAGTVETIQSAISVTRCAPKGPVYLTLPADVAVEPDRPTDSGPRPPALPASNNDAFDEILDAISVARRPIGVVGLALDPEKDVGAVRRFFSETNIPYVVLPQAKGVADEEGDGFLGTVAPAAGDSVIVEWLEQSDCLLGVGFDPVESSQDWHYQRPFYSLANGSVGFSNFRPTAECTGDVSVLLNRLREDYRGSSDWVRSELSDTRRQIDVAIRPQSGAGPAGLSPYHVMSVLREVMPRDAIAATDVGAHKMLLAQVWRTFTPNSFLVSNGLSAMGFGVPATLAAALLNPQRPVVGVVGDGGLGMMVQELETAQRMHLKPLFVVLCDRSLAVIKVAQDMRGFPYRGVDFGPVDWVKVADGFGARAATVSNLEELRQLCAGWLETPELTVLAIPIDETLYAGLTY